VVDQIRALFDEMPLESGLFFLFAFFLILGVIILSIDAWRQGAEKRAIRRRNRKAAREKHKRFVSNKKIAAKRVEWSPQATRAFMLAMRDPPRKTADAELAANASQETA
jgi:hypothetical protein